MSAVAAAIASASSSAPSTSRSAATALRRLPLKQAISSLQTGEGSEVLSPKIKSVSMRFVAKNAPSGPREFARTIAPRIAYANPTIPFQIDRIRDPRGVEKGKVLDAKSPDAGVKWESGMPEGELTVEIEGQSAPKSIPINSLTSSQILKALHDAAGTSTSA